MEDSLTILERRYLGRVTSCAALCLGKVCAGNTNLPDRRLWQHQIQVQAVE